MSAVGNGYPAALRKALSFACGSASGWRDPAECSARRTHSPTVKGLSRNNHSTFGATSGAGLHPAADFQSAPPNCATGRRSADAIGTQDEILPHWEPGGTLIS